MESDAQLVSSEFPIGVQLGSDQETYLAIESLSPCSSRHPDTSSTHATPIKDTATIIFHCRHHAFFFVFLTVVTPYSFEAISSKTFILVA